MKTRFAAAAALPLAAALALAGCSGTSGSGSMSGMDHGSGPMATATTAAEASQTDVMFVTMMIPHHEQAIEMSDTLLAKTGVDDRVTALAEQIKTEIDDGQDSEVIDLARSIVDGQTAEIATMKDLLASL